jgi:16S rRNA (cytidine1402-2'-O)-methyltransferase
MGILYVVATPVGNLSDVTYRAVEILKGVDLIACEDTRVAKKLLDAYGINVDTISYHQHSKLKREDYLIDFLKSGKSAALISDAGTPGISDPGGKLVERIYQENENLTEKIKIIPIPGPSALTAALSVSGLPADRFVFFGFLPHKKGRQKIFREISQADKTIVFYESVYRLLKTLGSLNDILSDSRQVIVAREITKQFEEIKRGPVGDLLKYYRNNLDKVKGEFVIIIGKKA